MKKQSIISSLVKKGKKLYKTPKNDANQQYDFESGEDDDLVEIRHSKRNTLAHSNSVRVEMNQSESPGKDFCKIEAIPDGQLTHKDVQQKAPPQAGILTSYFSQLSTKIVGPPP